MVHLDRKEIPRAVLNGKVRKLLPVYNLYRARLTQELMTRLNASYWKRAQGETDTIAGKWDPLKKSTIGIKRGLEVLVDPGIALNFYELVYESPSQNGPPFPVDTDSPEDVKRLRTPHQLDPEHRKIYDKEYNASLSRNNTRSSRAAKTAKARRDAWKAASEARDFASLINIRTGRLVAATSPGRVLGNRYIAPLDQNVEISPKSIHIDLDKIEYASDVSERRTIIPQDITVWIVESHDAVIDEVLALYEEMKAQ